jgi:dTDP-4-dehydrorhamnose 3,5-epimerase
MNLSRIANRLPMQRARCADCISRPRLYAQAKLIRVLRGRIFDVVVDLRLSSPSYGQHLAVELSEETGDQLFVPAGFAHGFCTLTPGTVVFYKVDNVCTADHDHGIN